MKDVFAEIDAIVMLTTSDWKSEPRSNRYHYATRLARKSAVIFVQADLVKPEYAFEETDTENVDILHVYQIFGLQQTALINQALLTKNIISPMLWVYNPQFVHFILSRYSPMMIFHATENHLCKDFPNNIFLEEDSLEQHAFQQVVAAVDLIISVADGVAKDLLENFSCENKLITLKNCCDLEFYDYLKHKKIVEKDERVRVFYQGAIFNKLDYELLTELVECKTEWEFVFCGRLIEKGKEHKKFFKHKNVKYLGELSAEQLRDEMYASSVGIIPYKPLEFVKKSHPLKAYEYLATGIPVISVPIDSLESDCQKGCVYFATTASEYKQQIQTALAETKDQISLSNRRAIVEANNYEKNFSQLQKALANFYPANCQSKKLNILVLYELHSSYVGTIKEHINAFAWYSAHNIFYAPASQNECRYDLSAFDVIIIHYSLRLTIRVGACTLSEDYQQKVQEFGGYKVLFLQDEYENTNLSKARARELGVNVIYTCVPLEQRSKVYFDDEFPHTRFMHNLTGYVSEQTGIERYYKPFEERENLIGYRGRNLPYYYGALGHEKYDIGLHMKQICMQRNIKSDIEVTEEKRIYKNDWYQFLANARATLGTESGSNIFDFTGGLREKYLELLEKKPDLKFEEVYGKYFKQFDNYINMNQVSPKIFEAISLRVALILFEGEYSGVVKPNEHYIPLKKDFSNIDEVLLKLEDADYIKQLTERAYQDIILSDKFQYKTFISNLDAELSHRVAKRIEMKIISGPLFYYAEKKLLDNSGSYVNGFAYNVITDGFIDDRCKYGLDMRLEPEKERIGVAAIVVIIAKALIRATGALYIMKRLLPKVHGPLRRRYLKITGREE